MFDKKSEYALNKHDQDSIIYISSRKGKNEGKGPNRDGENAGNTSVFKGYRNFN